jgi:hypothetical protein
MTTKAAAIRAPPANRVTRTASALSVLTADSTSVNCRIGLWRTADGSVLLGAAAYPLPAAVSISRSDGDDIVIGVGPWRQVTDH